MNNAGLLYMGRLNKTAIKLPVGFLLTRDWGSVICFFFEALLVYFFFEMQLLVTLAHEKLRYPWIVGILIVACYAICIWVSRAVTKDRYLSPRDSSWVKSALNITILMLLWLVPFSAGILRLPEYTLSTNGNQFDSQLLFTILLVALVMCFITLVPYSKLRLPSGWLASSPGFVFSRTNYAGFHQAVLNLCSMRDHICSGDSSEARHFPVDKLEQIRLVISRMTVALEQNIAYEEAQVLGRIQYLLSAAHEVDHFITLRLADKRLDALRAVFCRSQPLLGAGEQRYRKALTMLCSGGNQN